MKIMLMKKTLGVLALSAFGLMASGAQADWNRIEHRPGGDRHAHQQSKMFSQQINIRQERQMARIRAGRNEGRLTHSEFRTLLHEQREMRAMERHFRADGIIDAREFQRLDHALNTASRNIRTEKHDREARNTYGHPVRFY